ncbi:hypothetical protein J7E97_14380 [Streptomyces sp. ISL-66]|uniref:hypothetical protein n=1 Tax=Streptomyces sp. ISL-66 TaxID=2819186 RepID=UPI001BE8FD47|nr:hypothetical protein [Streptomyces sp. ISL-66]MBT2469022.1 hypothetical protein [Streptomyces sp. ISL-66]
MPRWVKIAAIAGILVVLAVLVVLFSGGEHGPGRHAGGAGQAAVMEVAAFDAGSRQLGGEC